MSIIKDTGFVNLSTFSNDAAVGAADWSNPGNAQITDNAYATHAATSPDGSTVGVLSRYLKATGPAGILVPSYAIILGIEVRLERSFTLTSAGGTVRDNSLKIVKNGAVGGNEKGDTGTDWPASDAYRTYGSSSDLWGLAWTGADINSNFGFAVSANAVKAVNPGTTTARIDHMQVRIHYDEVYDNGFFLVL